MVRFSLTRSGARLPERQTDGSAGFDLYIPKDTEIKPGRNIIKLGFSMAMPEGVYARIKSRSGFAVKGFCGMDEDERHDADVIEGTIDSDYRGEVGVIVKSYEPEWFTVKKGTRVAQMIFSTCLSPAIMLVGELDHTERGGGYGSTGVD